MWSSKHLLFPHVGEYNYGFWCCSRAKEGDGGAVCTWLVGVVLVLEGASTRRLGPTWWQLRHGKEGRVLSKLIRTSKRTAAATIRTRVVELCCCVCRDFFPQTSRAWIHFILSTLSEPSMRAGGCLLLEKRKDAAVSVVLGVVFLLLLFLPP